MTEAPESGKVPLTSALCRAARALLDWSQSDLADRAEVSRSTIRDFEGGIHEPQRATSNQLRLAFEQAGVVFVDVPAIGPGVCLRRS